MTDNRTNAQGVVEKINRALTGEFAGPLSREAAMRDALVDARRALLESAGRLAEEPSEEQALDALNAFYRTEHEQANIKRLFVDTTSAAHWGGEAVARMRAALKAAHIAPPVKPLATSGERDKNGADSSHAAPQAESAPPCSLRQEIPWPPYPSANFMYSRFMCEVCDWVGNTFKDVRGGEGAKLAREIAETHEAVQPSSTVDDMETVIENADEAWEHLRDVGSIRGRRTEYIARAVVEAIGGEGL